MLNLDSLSYSQSSISLINNLIQTNTAAWEWLYWTNWKIRRIASYYPELMGSNWGELVCDDVSKETETALNEKIKEDLKGLFVQGQINANLYGDSFIVKYVADNRELDEPIDYNNLPSEDAVTYSDRTYSKNQIIPDQTDSRELLRNPYNPEYYRFLGHGLPRDITLGQKIHKDRIIRFRGLILPPEMTIRNSGYSASILDGVRQVVMAFDEKLNDLHSLSKSFETLILKTELWEKLEQNYQEATDFILKRVSDIRNNLSVKSATAVDKEYEDIEWLSHNWTGLGEVLDKFLDEMIAASGIPRADFYAQVDQIKANSEEESFRKSEIVKAKQENTWSALILNECKVYTSASRIDNWSWKWSDGYKLTKTQETENLNKKVDSLVQLFDRQLLTPEEVRRNLLEYIKMDQTLDTKKTMPKPKSEQKEVDEPTEDGIKYDAVERFSPDGEVLPLSAYDFTLDDLMELETD